MLRNVLLGLWFIFGSLQAGTYYIDFSEGADNNNGLSKTTAWKRQPYMSGFSGSYSHQPGDRFIFKGGVTWDQTCWPITIATGGAPGNHDHYTVDKTWYNGGSWDKPVFNAQRQKNMIIHFKTTSYVTIDNLELTGLLATSDNGSNSSIYLSSCTHIQMQYLKIHNWDHSGSVTTDNGNFGGIYYNNGNIGTPLTGIVVDYCDIGNPENGGNQGSAVRMVETLSNSIIHDAPQGILHGGRWVFGNTFYNIGVSFDPAEHTNVAYLDGFNGRADPLPAGTSAYFYNNLIYDCPTNTVIYPNPGSSGVRSKVNFYIYNNVVYNSGICSTVDPYGAPSNYIYNVFYYNNTFVQPYNGQIFIYLVSRSGLPGANILEVINNHFISNEPSRYTSWTNISGSHNIGMSETQATSQGYTRSNHYAPSDPKGITVNAGTNLTSLGLAGLDGDIRGTTRPGSGAWDAGAYQYTSPSPVSFSASPVSGEPPLVVTFTNTSTGVYTAWQWDFGDGTTSTDRSPSHTYQDFGTYTVSLIGTGPGGSDTSTVQDYIRVRPQDVVIEAELMSLANGYLVDSTAMGGAGIMIDPQQAVPTTGTATTVFTGKSGTYDMTLYGVPENDGTPVIKVYIGDSLVLEQTYPQIAGYTNPAIDRQEYTIHGVVVDNGAEVRIEGISDSVAYARVDKLVFALVTMSISWNPAANADGVFPEWHFPNPLRSEKYWIPNGNHVRFYNLHGRMVTGNPPPGVYIISRDSKAGATWGMVTRL